jgi:hypothetical protein
MRKMEMAREIYIEGWSWGERWREGETEIAEEVEDRNVK